MLYWIWFVILSASGNYIVITAYNDKSESDKGSIGAALMVFSLIVSWPKVVSPIYDYFDALLPNSGETIHDATAVIIVAILAVLWVIMPVGIAELFSDKKGNLSWRNALLNCQNKFVNAQEH